MHHQFPSSSVISQTNEPIPAANDAKPMNRGATGFGVQNAQHIQLASGNIVGGIAQFPTAALANVGVNANIDEQVTSGFGNVGGVYGNVPQPHQINGGRKNQISREGLKRKMMDETAELEKTTKLRKMEINTKINDPSASEQAFPPIIERTSPR